MRVLFLGTPTFAQPTFQALLDSDHRVIGVLTRPDRPRGRSGTPRPSPVKQAALARDLPVLQPDRVNTSEVYRIIRELAPDVAVVVAFGCLLSGEFLAIPRHGCINLHGSLLPAYRGAAPVQWAVARGETETGITSMLLDEGMDTGDILLQRKVAIGAEETAAELADRLAALGGPLVVETLDGLEAGSLRPRPQPSQGASRAPLLRKEDGRLDWGREAKALASQVRGMQPWPVAHARSVSGRLKVFRASPVASPTGDPVPGTVLGAEADGVVVACGDGTALLLREVQPESRRRMAGREAIHGRALRAGEQLG